MFAVFRNEEQVSDTYEFEWLALARMNELGGTWPRSMCTGQARGIKPGWEVREVAIAPPPEWRPRGLDRWFPPWVAGLALVGLLVCATVYLAG